MSQDGTTSEILSDLGVAGQRVRRLEALPIRVRVRVRVRIRVSVSVTARVGGTASTGLATSLGRSLPLPACN